jgi:hypothetical protein
VERAEAATAASTFVAISEKGNPLRYASKNNISIPRPNKNPNWNRGFFTAFLGFASKQPEQTDPDIAMTKKDSIHHAALTLLRI